MGRHLHFDCFSGVSGDMILGALVSAGLSWTNLVDGLKRLRLSGYRLRKREVHRGALPAIKVRRHRSVMPDQRRVAPTQLAQVVSAAAIFIGDNDGGRHCAPQ